MKKAQRTMRALGRYLLTFAALAQLQSCNAARGKAVPSAIAHSNLAIYETNMNRSVHLQHYDDSKNELMQGIKLIDSMKTASSCKTKTTQQLLTSCSALDGMQSNSGKSAEELDKAKSQYAARLAVCELQEAERPPKLPRCSSLGSSDPASLVNRKQLAACLRELQDDMVFWGSYVNSLQNVGFMCQVARAEIEKEELIEHRRASLQTTILVTRVLSEFQQSVATQNAELLTHAKKLRELHRQNVEELANARNDTSEILHQLREEFHAQLQKVADKAEAVIETVTASASGTNEEVVRYVQNVQHSLAGIWQMMAEGNAQLAARQLQDSQESHEMALATQRALETIVIGKVGGLSDAVLSLSNDLLLAGSQVTSIRQGHALLAEDLDQSLAKSAHVADTLEKLNVPILEMLAKAASFVNFVFSDAFLILLGFLSPIVVILLCAAFFQFRLMSLLLRTGILLFSAYMIRWAHASWDSSTALRKILQGAWQATAISLALVVVCCIVCISFQKVRRTCPPPPRPREARVILHATIEDDDDDQVSREKRARNKSIENAMKPRTGRASTAPPC